MEDSLIFPASRVAPGQFQYRPILPPNEIRMLEVLPSEGGQPVQVRLSHCPLSDLPKCEALSYEWGSPTRDYNILCEGNVLKVTANLLAALKRLRYTKSKRAAFKGRRFPGQPRLLWIDAICINQEDLAERSQQVKLMTYIYRTAGTVLIWIGEEQPLTREAFNVIKHLAKACKDINLEKDDLNLPVDEFDPWVQKSVTVGNGFTLERLVEEPIWPAVADLLASRTYFQRLWTVQEIAMSAIGRSKVICGTVSCDWLVFYRAARLMFGCEYLQDTVRSITNLQNIVKQYGIQRRFHRGSLDLWFCIESTMDHSASETVDRIFALLGMLDEKTRFKLRNFDYTSSSKNLFRAATEIFLVEGQHLKHFSTRNIFRQAREYNDTPSWVLYPDPQHILRFGNSGIDLALDANMIIEGSVLNARGFIFDIVIYASENFSEKNTKGQVLAAYRESDTLRSPFPGNTKPPISPLAEALMGYNADDDTAEAQHTITSCISEWMLEDFGITREVNKVPYRDGLAPGFPSISLKNAPEPTGGGNTMALSPQTRYGELNSLLQIQAQLAYHGKPEHARRRMANFAYQTERQTPTDHYGRNLFATSKGYWGMGPMGDNRPGFQEPAVQINDKIAVLATVEVPVILRPCGDGCYIFVGPASVPYLSADPFFELGNTSSIGMQTIKIK